MRYGKKIHDVETKEHLVQLGIVNHESVFFNVEKGRYFWVEREHPHIPVFPRRRKNASRIQKNEGRREGGFCFTVVSFVCSDT